MAYLDFSKVNKTNKTEDIADYKFLLKLVKTKVTT